jgi:coproporphyrinogen III oxidase
VHFHAPAATRWRRWAATCTPLQALVRRVLLQQHRGEARGIGGIFFDDFAEGGLRAGFAHDARGGRCL